MDEEIFIVGIIAFVWCGCYVIGGNGMMEDLGLIRFPGSIFFVHT